MLVGKALTYDLRYSQLKTPKIVCIFSVVIPEYLFVDVAEQVIWLYADICSVESAFQQAPEILNSICVDIAVHVLNGVVDDCVILAFCESVIGLQFVSKERATSFDILADGLLKFLFATSINVKRSHFAIALYHPEHDFFVHPASAVNTGSLFATMHVPSFTADHGFIGFHFSAQLSTILALHCEADTMEHEPRGLLSNAKCAVKLPGTNSVLTINNHPNCGEPLLKADRGVLEDSSSLQAELWAWMFTIAFPNARLFEIDRTLRIALWTANRTVWPAQFNHELAAILVVLKVDNRFSECVA
jgi:hypothetical protein